MRIARLMAMQTVAHGVEPTVAFVGVPPSITVRDFAIQRIRAALEDDVLDCRVALEAQRHKHCPARFRARVELQLPHTTLIVGSGDESFGDVFAAIDAAAVEARRTMREHARWAHHPRRHS